MDLGKYKVFVFDMDNTLVASEPFHIRAFGRALKEMLDYDLTWADGQEYIGITSTEMAGRILSRLGRTDVVPKDVSILKTKILMENFTTEIYPGAREFLETAKSRGKWRMVLASNSVPQFINRVLTDGGLDGIFQRIFTCFDVKKTKPDPEIFIKAAAELEVTPGECLVFEDSDAGLAAARACGMDSVLMLNPGNLIPENMPVDQPAFTWAQLGRMI